MSQQRWGRWARGVGGVCAGLGASACAATEGWAIAEHSAASPWWGLLVAAVALAGCVVDSSPRRDAGGEGGEGGDGGGGAGGGGAGGEGGGGAGGGGAGGGGAGGGGAGGDGGGTPDLGLDLGFWETCCLADGTISECYCDGGGSCNYGWFEVCGDGRCTYSFDCDDDMGPPDGGPPDLGPPDVGPPEGEWEACCDDGTVSTCSCPVGAECNYGWFTPCADGACGFETCLETDPAIFHQVCCRDGRMTTCACRAGEACEVEGARYQACPGGACVGEGAACP